MDPGRIPAPLIHIVADVLSTHHQSHTKISTLFLRCGAPELSTGGNLINRITAWLKESERPFSLLGCVLENFMELDTQSPDWLKGKEKIANALSKYGLAYERGGRIIGGATGAPSRTLDAIIQTRDLPAVRAEFDRAIDTVERDPPTAITSACAIVESLCKVYINENGLTLPSDQSIRPLWKQSKNT